MKTLLEQRKEKGVLVAAHRGVSSGNIPCNTIAAFDIALQEGADILEMDIFKSVDDTLYVFHTGKELAHLNRNINLEKMTSKEIKELKLVNADLSETYLSLNTLDEVLEHYKGKCILNLDRCVHILDYVVPAIEHHNMKDQILLKSDPSMKSLKMVETYAPTYMYMPIFMENDNAFSILETMNINCIGVELVFESEASAIIQKSYIETMKKKGKLLWVNSLVYASKVKLAAGHNDDISMMGRPEEGWGWLLDKGFDIIQTDWTHHCIEYVKKYGKRE